MYIEPEKIKSKILDDDMKEYKKRILNILIDFDKFLKENNIKYSLNSGTLLGAIRHKGFIPWDDDIDIAMTRKEFCKLLKVVDKFNSDIYEVYIPFDKSSLASPRMIKIYDKNTCIKEFGDKSYTGAFIDVFSCIDVKKYKRRKIESNMYRLMTSLLMFKNKRNEKGIFKTKSGLFTYFLSKIISKKYLENKIKEKYEKEYDGEFCYSSFGSNKYYRKKIFEEIIEGEFEGYKFPILKYYDEYLSIAYGNYLELPPEDKRNPHHLEYLNLNESYVEKNRNI